ncbi:hypothetical protein D0Z07_9199 [Hyphodiscus hymeniophilus]|uniref:Uncharacterized protein n=1 Tax=Hyphodiscus hymeniophilus TaxID=353542 RepID=A0A9P6SMR4_9HELO|nr:hypothetical protein D0Z07_9199 [Hyphodiscus hymeniophilus]
MARSSLKIGLMRFLRALVLKAPQNSISTKYISLYFKTLYLLLSDNRRKILGSIVILFSPLPAASLAKVSSISGIRVTQTLERLQAILDIPKDVAGLLRLYHPSFRDFLLNKDRCGDY